MTVGELIVKLQALHPDLTVIMDVEDAPEYGSVDSVVLDNGKVYLSELCGYEHI